MDLFPVSSTSQPLVGLLRRVSMHLDDMAARVYHVEHAIGDEFAHSTPQTSDSIQRLQNLDLLRQSLEDLSLLMLYLSQSEEICAHQVQEIERLTTRLNLDATKSLLEGVSDPVTSSFHAQSDGEVDFF